jgi:serum/glucocorticoid-regulated kinase 2
LKPENVLIDEQGYLVLTDLGLAKIVERDEVAQTFCGTPEYMAPEIQNEEDGYKFEVDWWSLGILCYEMIVGFAPFYAKAGQDPDSIFRIIRKKKIIFPDPVLHGIAMSDDCKDFITKMTQKDFKKRLGHKNDVEDVISHPWF